MANPNNVLSAAAMAYWTGELDSVMTADAGPPPTITLQVAANPNNVLSAVATVSWTGALDSATITWAGGTTPSVNLTGGTSPISTPILGLTAATTYDFVATGASNGEQVAASDAVELTTAALPDDMPVFNVQGTSGDDGFTLLGANLPPSAVDYVIAVDGSGTPVWYYAANGVMSCDFQQQPDGTFTVAVWDPTRSIPNFEDPIALEQQFDVLGNPLHTWMALGPDQAGNAVVDVQGNEVTVAATDGHEIRIQPDGTALLFGYVTETMDLSAFGGSATAIVAGDVLERVTGSGQVLFAWNTLEYFDLLDLDPAAASIAAPTVDLTHANSIDVTADGNYLVSMRSLSQVVKINATTGAIMWQLGGAGISSPSSGGPTGDFTFVNDPLGGFSCQHGVRELPNGDIILFDDGDGHTPPQSRGAEYALDMTAMTATLVWESTPSSALFTPILGYAQRLGDGNTLVTYGMTNTLEEWDPTGTSVQWTLTDPANPLSFYRGYRLGSLYAAVAP